MDLLALLGLGALVRFFRRRRAPNTHQPPETPTLPSSLALASAQLPFVQRTSSAKRRLVLRAVYGMLLAFVVVLFALIPWPSAWAISAALAPHVYCVQAFVVRNVDALTVGAVGIAVVEPLLVGLVCQLCRIGCLLFSSIFQLPHLIWQIICLARLIFVLAYWQIRRRRAHQCWQRCCAQIS